MQLRARAFAPESRSVPASPSGGAGIFVFGPLIQYVRRHYHAQLALLLGPTLLWVVMLILVPSGLVIVMSFWSVDDMTLIPEFTFSNYERIFTRFVYYATLLKSMKVAGIVTGCSLALAVPLAWLISFRIKNYKTAWFSLVVISLWVGYLLRAYSWRIILGQSGILNGLLISLGIVDEPVEAFLFNEMAVVIALTHLATPFALIPIYTVFEQVRRELHEAAADLYAGPVRTALFVTLPITVHGIIAGAAFAFILSFGDFLAPILVGGPSNMMIANVAASQFGAAFQWPLGSAIAVVMFLTVILVLALPHVCVRFFQRRAKRRVVAPLASARGVAR